MNYVNFSPYAEDNLRIKALVICYSKENAMLICPENGAALAVNRKIAERIEHLDLDHDIIFLLVQRGMADYSNSRPVPAFPECSLPHFFLIDLTHGCNLRCKYCFRELEDEPHRMSDDTLQSVCEALCDYWRRHPEIHLTLQAWGGEPMICIEQIRQIRSCFSARGLDPELVIETNGTLLTEKNIRILRDADVHIGISIDGFPAVQDFQRPDVSGNETSSRIESGIERLRKAGINRFGTITVVTENTPGNLKKILDYFANHLKLTSVKFNPLRQTASSRDLGLSLVEMEHFAADLLSGMIRLHRNGYRMIERNIAQRLRNLTCRSCDNICSAHGCHGGYEMLSVDYNGMVYPCELSDFPELAIGKIGEKKIEEMLAEAIENKNRYFTARTTPALSCNGCPWQFYCGGGCKAASLFAYDDPGQIDEMECAYNKAMYPLLTELILNDPETAVSLMG